MAANSKSRSIASLGKRLVSQIWIANPGYYPTRSFALSTRRATYCSTYEKNQDDLIQASAVPDDVIQATQSDKYWSPHPQTGVFGPAAETGPSPTTTAGVERGDAGADSVLEEKAWFRPVSLEDLEKPNQQP